MTYLITKTETCSLCDGYGVIETPIWSRFFEETKYNKNKEASEAKKHQWFTDNGWEDLSKSGYPTQEVDCDICNSEGVVRTEIELKDALVDLGFIKGITSEFAY